MLESLNQQLSEVKEKIRMREKYESSLSSARNNLKLEQARLNQLEHDMHKEGADVEKLEGLSLTGLFYTVLGSKETQLDKERQEYLASKLKYDRCKFAVSSLQEEISYLTRQLDQFEGLNVQYNSILERKENLISAAGDSNSARRLFQISESLAEVRSDAREINEALNAGSEVLGSLDNLIASLKSASGWGTWDMLGGGLIATAVKHSKIDESREIAHQTQQLLQRFQRELEDVGTGANLVVEIGSFAAFADYFLDGLIADWIVQSGIQRSLNSAVQVKDRVQKTVKDLKKAFSQVKKKSNALEAERQKLVETA